MKSSSVAPRLIRAALLQEATVVSVKSNESQGMVKGEQKKLNQSQIDIDRNKWLINYLTNQPLPNNSSPKEMVKELEGHVRGGLVSREVWISPGLPMLVFFTLGYVLTITLGDVTLWLIRSLVQF